MPKTIMMGYSVGDCLNGIDTYITEMIKENHENEYVLLTTQKTHQQLIRYDKYGVIIREVPSLRHPIKQYRTIQAIAKAYKPDEAYFNISESFNGLGAIAAKNAFVPAVTVHSHSSDAGGSSTFLRPFRRILHYMFRPYLLTYADKRIGCSKQAGDWMFGNRKYEIRYNEVDKSRFRFNKEVRQEKRQELGIGNKYVIGHVGELSYAKNQEYILEIARSLKRRGEKNIVFLLVGKGTDDEKFRNEIRRQGLEEMVMTLGPRYDMPALYWAMDLFILPSRFEGHPIAALEAQAAGLRILISDKIEGIDGVKKIGIDPEDIRIWENQILFTRQPGGLVRG